MNSSSSLPELLQRPDLWRARLTAAGDPEDRRPGTGFLPLDRALHRGGWPLDGLVELLCPGDCPPMLRLLLPCLAATEEGLVILAGPPARPHTRTLTAAGLDPSRLLILHSSDNRMLLRACREAAASETVAAMVVWAPPGLDDTRVLRRLHLAARQGRCRLFLIRNEAHLEQPSPAPLRLHVRPCLPGDLDIRIHKQAGGRAGQRLRLPVLPEALRAPTAAVPELPAPQQAWRSQEEGPVTPSPLSPSPPMHRGTRLGLPR